MLPTFNALKDTVGDAINNHIKNGDIMNQNNIPINNPYQPTTYGFGEYAPLPTESRMQDDTPNVSMGVSSLLEQPYIPKPVNGLPMGDLITSSTPVNNGEPTYANANFNNLVYQDTRNIGREFSVAMVPEGQERSMLPKPELHNNKNNSNAQNNNSGKKINNWFSRLIDQKGAEYITSGKLTADEVGKNAERIIDDMVNGRIDYNVYGQYIIIPSVIETLINYCYNKIAINNAIQFSLGYTYNDYVSRMGMQDAQRVYILNQIDDSMFRNITQAISIVNQDLYIFNTIYTKLNYVNTTKNASVLFSIASELKNYNRQAKKRY